MCRHVPPSINMWRHSRQLWYQSFAHDMDAVKYQHLWTCRHMCQNLETCRWHVRTCNITLSTSDTNQLDLILVLACVSTCGHVDMCWHVLTCANTFSTSDTNADKSRHVRTCANTFSNFETNHFKHSLVPTSWGVLACVNTWKHADTCRYVLTCASMCQHVTSLFKRLMPIIWSLSGCWLLSAHSQYLWGQSVQP